MGFERGFLFLEALYALLIVSLIVPVLFSLYQTTAVHILRSVDQGQSLLGSLGSFSLLQSDIQQSEAVEVRSSGELLCRLSRQRLIFYTLRGSQLVRRVSVAGSLPEGWGIVSYAVKSWTFIPIPKGVRVQATWWDRSVNGGVTWEAAWTIRPGVEERISATST